MTYLSVIAAAGAAALIAASAQADVATGHTSGKRIHKPTVASGQTSGRRMHKPVAAIAVTPRPRGHKSAMAACERRHQPLRIIREVDKASPT